MQDWQGSLCAVAIGSGRVRLGVRSNNMRYLFRRFFIVFSRCAGRVETLLCCTGTEDLEDKAGDGFARPCSVEEPSCCTGTEDLEDKAGDDGFVRI